MFAHLGAIARFTGRGVLDALLPPQCLTCDTQVDAPGRLCAACFGRTTLISDPCCAACGVPFAAAGQGGLDRLCVQCRVRPPSWGAARAAFRYDDQARRILLPFKHGDRVESARAIAPLMIRAAGPLLPAADLLVPVPLHRTRLIARRYNQSALLARHIARVAGKPAILDGLQRIRTTRPLGGLTAAQRTAELAGAFRVRPTRRTILDGARILLIDDVLTSGATAEACTLALLAGGAARVDVLAAARVRDPRET